jgi:hypothetical protein
MLGAYTFAPAAASARLKACPSPVLPPVTMAFRPASENRSSEKSVISRVYSASGSVRWMPI